MKEVAGFLLRLACWYGALLILWLPLGYGYRKTLIFVGNGLARFAAPGESVSFRVFADGELGETHARADVGVLVHDATWHDAQGRNQHVLAKRIATFYQPYSATAFLIALWGASRVARRRRLIGGAFALAALHLVMLACVVVDVVFTFASNGALLGLPRWFGELLAFLHVSVTDWPAGVLLAPLLLWAVVLWPAFGFGERQSKNPPRAT